MLKRFWNWLLGKTTIDEKVIEVVEEVKEDIQVIRERAKRVAEETRDVLEAAKEVAKQSKDVVDAAKGAPRKGRKPQNRRKPAAKKAETAPAPEVAKPAAKRTASKGRRTPNKK